MYPNLFVPAGYTFSIWSVIYLALLHFTLYQLGLFRGREHPGDPVLLKKTAVVFSFRRSPSLLLFAWHYGAILLYVVIMVFLLLC